MQRAKVWLPRANRSPEARATPEYLTITKGIANNMLTRKQKLIRAAAAVTAVGATAATALVGSTAVQADPIQYSNPLRTYGSDTIQDVTNAFAGYSNGVFFDELRTSNDFVVVSWDAFPANSCIAPAPNFGLILRPNGSSNGQRVLSAAKNGFSWPFSPTSLCGGQKAVPSSLVQFSRSSSGPGSRENPTGALTWLPMGRDNLSFAYAKPSGTFPTQTEISAADLTALHLTGPQLVNGTPVIACGIQDGSGTYGSWMDRIGLDPDITEDSTGTATCNLAGGVPDTDGRLQENNSPELIAKAGLLGSMTSDICDGVAGGAEVSCEDAQLVIGYSASQFIARGNGVGFPDSDLSSVNGGMGKVAEVAANPVTGTAPNLAPVAAAYSDATFGRDVYYIAPTADVTGFLADPNLTEMLVGPTSEVCSAVSTIEQHGFLSLGSACGSTDLRGDYRTP